MKTFIKDPNAKLDYAIDWSKWLRTGEKITSSTWSVEDGLVLEAQSIENDEKTIVWLSGGTAGNSYLVTNHIVTNQGREDERSFKILVAER